jgi:hypothetical protein
MDGGVPSRYSPRAPRTPAGLRGKRAEGPTRVRDAPAIRALPLICLGCPLNEMANDACNPARRTKTAACTRLERRDRVRYHTALWKGAVA